MPGLSQAVGFGLEATASGEPDSDREDTGTEHHSRLTPVEGLTAERGRSMGAPKGGVLESGRAGSACAKALRQRERRGTEGQPVGPEPHEGRVSAWCREDPGLREPQGP